MSDHGQGQGPPAGKGRPNLTGRLKATVASAEQGKVPAALRASFDNDDRTTIVVQCETALATGARPLDVVMSTYAVDAATADALCREAM